MTDIVDRLRTVASSADHLWLADLLSEAADRIEAMRKDMENIQRRDVELYESYPALGVAKVGTTFVEITKDMRYDCLLPVDALSQNG